MTHQILLTAIDLKIVAVLIETATIIVIDRPNRSVVIDESVMMYVVHVLPE
jgi:hypothetical protein